MPVATACYTHATRSPNASMPTLCAPGQQARIISRANRVRPSDLQWTSHACLRSSCTTTMRAIVAPLRFPRASWGLLGASTSTVQQLVYQSHVLPSRSDAHAMHSRVRQRHPRALSTRSFTTSVHSASRTHRPHMHSVTAPIEAPCMPNVLLYVSTTRPNIPSCQHMRPPPLIILDNNPARAPGPRTQHQCAP